MYSICTRIAPLLALGLLAPLSYAQYPSPTVSPLYRVENYAANVIENTPSSLTLYIFSPEKCESRLSESRVDLNRKQLLVRVEPTSPCVATSGGYGLPLPSVSLPQGRYEIKMLFGVPPGLPSFQIAASTTLSVSRQVAGLRVENQSLLVNPGIAGQEQFVTITTREDCPSLTLTPTVSVTGSTINVLATYGLTPGQICPGLKPPPISVTRLLSLGKIPAGTYNLSVDVPAASGTANVLKTTLVIDGTASPPADATGAWYDPNEDGWGIVMIERNGIVFATWYVFDEFRKPYWYVMPAGKRDGGVIKGDLYDSRGSDYRYNWEPRERDVNKLDTGYIVFTGPKAATVYGMGITRNVRKLEF